MKLSKFLTTSGVTTILVIAQMFGLPNQKPKMAQAHCPLDDPLHCASHGDPTRVIPGSAKVAEEAWGEAGRGLYRSAAEFMTRDNIRIPRRSLDSRQKELLRPEFGSLVDRVTVQYGADMMDRWGSGNFQISQGSAGQTFCNKIYIQAPYRENDYNQLILLAHELQHSRQCENFGGMSNFGYRYFKEFKKAGQSYANNALEREAENVARRVAQYVATQPIAPSQNSQACMSTYNPRSYRPGTSGWTGRIGQIAFNNGTNRRVTVKLYHPDAPSRVFKSWTVQPKQNLFLGGDNYGMDWGIQADNSPICIVGKVSAWNRFNGKFIFQSGFPFTVHN